ncbi:hypothetical protein PROFUN_10991 [Planoprotostelium fungivorum]|uniref:Uncharacterized protein n=1 Tax=Planoprotostelium fungivorum TaxID=1890364 RepID=A0A2P6NBY1_9EUKA|nr:hypothetical protein PROFUN_10991 [Planoprotostelium fungivorum]
MTGGRWEVEQGGKCYFCVISGGYVMIGTRPQKTSYEVVENENIPVESYATSPSRSFIKQHLGDKTLDEIDKKVRHIVEIRNKATSGPGKE